jgi:hypothetical protein
MRIMIAGVVVLLSACVAYKVVPPGGEANTYEVVATNPGQLRPIPDSTAQRIAAHFCAKQGKQWAVPQELIEILPVGVVPFISTCAAAAAPWLAGGHAAPVGMSPPVDRARAVLAAQLRA